MKRGVSRSSRTWRRGAVAARHRSTFVVRTNEVLRTAKPCGPGAPTLASSWRRCLRIALMMVARKPGHQGERGVSRSNHCAGKAWCFQAEPVVPAPCIFLSARGPRVPAGIRPSLRPLTRRRVPRNAKLGQIQAARTRSCVRRSWPGWLRHSIARRSTWMRGSGPRVTEVKAALTRGQAV
jgi:hypothetical protein